MKPTFIKIIFIIVLVLKLNTVNAQYGTGLGVRYGTDSNIGLTVLQFLGDRNQGAINVIISAPYNGVRASGCFELHISNHNENIEVAHVGFFIGAGGHTGRYKTIGWMKDGSSPINKENVITVGVDGIAGIEWKLPEVPLLLSLDVHPFIDLNYQKQQPEIFELGLSLRYLL
ncbi:MAG TPA: hypothetical protein PKK00_00520 [Bacteroidales bacterium]|nr:hypothetical protein [Bacteroidales bacterium]HPS16009.1 hypothetical protein [Bacteroidales bacterium]